MKRFFALLLAAVMLLSLAACTADADTDQTAAPTQATQTAYVISDEVKEGSVVDGLMTDISLSDPILKKTVAPWLDDCVLYEVNIRQYTEEGTFKAFEAHLQRLKEMGVTCLWLMPIHPISETERKGTLGSYYAVDDYYAVNPEFGAMDDFKHLLNTAHDMGFKVILDWVANHTGWDNPWITEHDDWYAHTDSGKIESPYDWTDVAQLEYDNYEMRAEMIRAMTYWVEEIGVDGFRCDHAVGVPTTFWNAAVYKLKSVNSDILMLAEASASPGLTGYAFDSCYNDKLYGESMMVQSGVGVSTIVGGVEISDNYAESSFPMNYLDNHDKNSYDGSIVERMGDSYPTLLGLTFIAPGMPLIYTGNEMGLDHELAFFEKDPIAWDADPKYSPLIAALSGVKAANPALDSTNRELGFVETSNSKVICFSRTKGDNTVWYLGNLSSEKAEGVTIDPGISFDRCALHFDGATDDAPESVTADMLQSYDYQPYEFFILTSE